MKNDEIILRKGTKRDVNAFCELDNLCFEEGIAYPKEEFSYYLKLKNLLCYVIEEQNKIVAFIIANYQKSYAQIITIDVHPDYRRKGYAERLMKLVEEELIKANVRFIFLYVAENNNSAIKLYQKLCYEIHGKVPNYYKHNLDAYVMIKNL